MGNGSLYWIGGTDSRAKDCIHIETLQKGNKACLAENFVASVKAQMHFGRRQHSVCSLGKHQIVVTGTQVKQYAAAVSDRMVMSSLSTKRDLANMPEVGSCEVYDILKDQWSLLPKMNQHRSRHSSCAFQNRYVYVFFGKDERDTTIFCVERLDMQDQERQDEKGFEWEKIVLKTTYDFEKNIDFQSGETSAFGTNFGDEILILASDKEQDSYKYAFSLKIKNSAQNN